MPKSKYPKGMSEADKLALSQKRAAKQRAAGKAAGKSEGQIAYDRRTAVEARAKEARKEQPTKPKTQAEKARESAAGTRQEIIEAVPGTGGLQALQDILAPKKPKKKR